MDRRMNWRTDKGSYRVACPQLKKKKKRTKAVGEYCYKQVALAPTCDKVRSGHHDLTSSRRRNTSKLEWAVNGQCYGNRLNVVPLMKCTERFELFIDPFLSCLKELSMRGKSSRRCEYSFLWVIFSVIVISYASLNKPKVIFNFFFPNYAFQTHTGSFKPGLKASQRRRSVVALILIQYLDSLRSMRRVLFCATV